MNVDGNVVDAFQNDGVIILRGVGSEFWIEELRAGINVNMTTPCPYTRNYTKEGERGFFFGDYCNWQLIPHYKSFLFETPAANIAAQLMGASKVNFFHEHILVKEPCTEAITPWHHDQPYYCVNGFDTCSLWIPLDSISRDTCVQFISGSHRWGRWFTPTKFVGTQFEKKDEEFEEIPDFDSQLSNYDVLSWDLTPGDCIAFNFLTVHAAPGNSSRTSRWRAFAARFTGDDVRYLRRKGEMSPPFPDLALEEGGPIDCSNFPKIFPHG